MINLKKTTKLYFSSGDKKVYTEEQFIKLYRVYTVADYFKKLFPTYESFLSSSLKSFLRELEA